MKITVRVHTSHLEEVEVPNVWYRQHEVDCTEEGETVTYSRFTVRADGIEEIGLTCRHRWRDTSPESWELETNYQSIVVVSDYQSIVVPDHEKMVEAKWNEKLAEFRAWLIKFGFFEDQKCEPADGEKQ